MAIPMPASSDKDFADLMPTEPQFEILDQLVNLLMAFHKSMKELTTEKPVVTIHLVVVILYNFRKKLFKSCSNNPIQEWSAFVTAEMDKVYPAHGCLNKHYALAHFFDPFYRGYLAFAKAKNPMDSFIGELVEEVGEGFNVRSQTTESDVINPSSEILSVDDVIKRTAQLKNEINLFLNLIPKMTNSSVDVLQFWKENEERLPLLASLARRYLCIPTSGSKTDFPEEWSLLNLDPDVNRTLILVNENLSRVKYSEHHPK